MVLKLAKEDAERALGRKAVPALQLLLTMASFVPPTVRTFRHPLIPEGYRHADVPQVAFKRPRTSASGISTVEEQDELGPDSLNAIYKHMADSWDEFRSCNEPEAARLAAPTIVRSVKVMDDKFQAVTLGNNRYCLCKGGSHKSNSIYLVLDLVNRTYHQKCFDPDCKWYRGPPFNIPDSCFEAKGLLEKDGEVPEAAGG